MKENFVVAEMVQGEHEPYAGRCWASDAPTRLEALREVAAANPGHGPLKIVDGPSDA